MKTSRHFLILILLIFCLSIQAKSQVIEIYAGGGNGENKKAKSTSVNPASVACHKNGDSFVYDIYSDAVNTAARMESHGEPGKIHVSEEFAFHLQNRMDMVGDDLGGIVFEEREEIEIKGKGWMKTYFLEAKS